MVLKPRSFFSLVCCFLIRNIGLSQESLCIILLWPHSALFHLLVSLWYFESLLTPYVWTPGEEECVCVWEGGKGHILQVDTNPNCRKEDEVDLPGRPAGVEQHWSSAFWAFQGRLQNCFLKLLLLSELGLLVSLRVFLRFGQQNLRGALAPQFPIPPYACMPFL